MPPLAAAGLTRGGRGRPSPETLRIGTMNAEWLFDGIADPVPAPRHHAPPVFPAQMGAAEEATLDADVSHEPVPSNTSSAAVNCSATRLVRDPHRGMLAKRTAPGSATG
jgi:hypothetical protein